MLHRPVEFTRAAGLTAGAEAVYSADHDAYIRLIDATRVALQSVDDSQSRQRADGWAALVKMQSRAGDTAGAQEFATSAGTPGDSASAYEAIVAHAIKIGDLKLARDAAESSPAGMDPKVGQDRRGEALGQVTEALARSGDGRAAASLLETIDPEHVRELKTADVAAALIRQGDQAEATELAVALRRQDARERALSVVFRALAEARMLPDPETLMSRVPRRQGGKLCWMAAIAGGEDPDGLSAWLAQLDQPACRAFAYAGAAYATLAGPADRDPEALFSRYDPSQMEARMIEAMQRNAAGYPAR